MDNTVHIERAKILADDITRFLQERTRLNPHTSAVAMTALGYVLRDQLASTPPPVQREMLAGISDLVLAGSGAVVFKTEGQIE